MRTLLKIALCWVVFLGLLLAVGCWRVEQFRFHDPTGKYEAVVTSRFYLSFLPMPPGSGLDSPGFVEIRDEKGSLGRVPVPMLQLAGVEWHGDTASLPLIAEWDLKNRTCFTWSEDGMTQIWVRK